MTGPGLRQWDLVRVRINANDRDEHPAVVVSPQELLDDPTLRRINVLYGSTKRPAGSLRSGMVILDTADGCEHATTVDCAFFNVVRKDAISSVMGHVTPARRRKIQQTISAALRFFQ